MKLASKRLIFRKLKRSDFKEYATWYKNADSMKYIHGKPLSDEQINVRFEKDIFNNVLHMGLGTFAVHHKENGEFMGICKLNINEDQVAEVSFGTFPNFWKQKYGTEMLDCLTKYASTFGFVHQIKAITNPKNTPSVKILKNHKYKIEKEGKDNKGKSFVAYNLNIKHGIDV